MGEASGSELTDDTEDQLTEDLAEETEAEPEESAEPPESDDLPEGLTEPEAGKETPPAEPSGESEVDRLKRLGVFKEGLIESDADLAKSYKHAQDFISSTRRAPREDATQEPGSTKEELDQLAQALLSNDPQVRLAATARVANAVNYGQKQELEGINERLFAGTHEDFNIYSTDIQANKDKYPGIDIEDAYNMALGKNRDTLVSEASKTASANEQRRETDKQRALREKPGAGVRTGPVDLESRLSQLAIQYEGTELIRRMKIECDKAGK
jgi:hypothetical protein